MANEGEYLSPAEVAKVLGVGTKTVFRRLGSYPGVIDLTTAPTKRGMRRRRMLRVPRAVLNRFLYEHRVT